MSFSREVKNELISLDIDKVCCQKAELTAFFALKGKLETNSSGWYASLQADHAAMARRIFKLLKSYPLQPKIILKHSGKSKNRSFIVEVPFERSQKWILDELNVIKSNTYKTVAERTNNTCCQRAFLRAVYICRGFINRPEGNYHLELTLPEKYMAERLKKILDNFAVEARISARKGNHILYLKDSDKISDFLRIIEASRALLEFENVRIIKSMRNNINRQVNCETANLGKTVNASLRQTKIINMLAESPGIENLPLRYRQLARLRLESPDSTLQELGEKMTPPLSKSGVAYRMKCIERLARKIYGNDI